jgi:UDPglucose 6-dehydrogenase
VAAERAPVRVCVAGLWHLGCVTAACLASAGHTVVGFDDDPDIVASLMQGRPPVLEPGLDSLVQKDLATGMLTFTTDRASALRGADVLWIAWDTPVDEDDRVDAGLVRTRAERLFLFVESGTLVIVSSQLAVGSTAALARRFAETRPAVSAAFACCPENLRLGCAIDRFMKPDRVVVGARPEDRQRIARLYEPFTDRIEWMSIESAEMAKHALNAFLATSVAFINEIATVCERVGADASDVARALKTDERIGPRAYLSPGDAFAGGTLARDVVVLTEAHRDLQLISAVRASNEAHRLWAARRIEALLGSLDGRTIGVWGLTYKPGTDTLRRSSAIALCRTLADKGALVRAHDPAIRQINGDLKKVLSLAASPIEAVRGADVLVIATAWPQFRDVPADEIVGAGVRTVLDAGGFLAETLGADPRVHYITVGSAT